MILLDFTFFKKFYVFAHFSRSLVLSHYHVIDSPYITLWAFKKDRIDKTKNLEVIDYGFIGFDTTFSKNLFELFKICL